MVIFSNLHTPWTSPAGKKPRWYPQLKPPPHSLSAQRPHSFQPLGNKELLYKEVHYGERRFFSMRGTDIFQAFVRAFVGVKRPTSSPKAHLLIGELGRAALRLVGRQEEVAEPRGWAPTLCWIPGKRSGAMPKTGWKPTVLPGSL